MEKFDSCPDGGELFRIRNIHRRCSVKKGVLKNFAHRKTVLESLFRKVAGLKNL